MKALPESVIEAWSNKEGPAVFATAAAVLRVEQAFSGAEVLAEDVCLLDDQRHFSHGEIRPDKA